MGMTTTEKIRVIAKRVNMNMGDLAEATGQTRQNLSNKMSRNNLTEKEIAAMGCTMEIKFKLPDGSVI